MKKLLLALLFCLSFSAHADYVYDKRFPTFEVNGAMFALTFQQEESSVVILQNDGTSWISWGGSADLRGELFNNVTDDQIMAYGSLYNFITYCMAEAVRRAALHSAIPLPNPNDRIDRLQYAIKNLIKVDNNVMKLAPPPLP